MTILHEIVIKIKGKLTEAWNIGHNDLDIVSGHSLGHMELISQVWHLSNKYSRYKAKSLNHEI